MSKTTKSWFGVKSIYRWTASGKPIGKNRGYSHDATLVEERVVIFQARDQSHALTLAEREAKKYTKSTYANPFGQKVTIRWLKQLDSFELFDLPGSGVEIFSSTELVSSSVSDNGIRTAKFGQREKVTKTFDDSVRLKFSNAELFARLLEV